MITALIDILSWILILAGGAFIVVGALGLVRLPDMFSRMHGASLIDTSGGGLMLIGFMLQAGFSLVALKLLFLLALMFMIGPVISHALAQAALEAGLRPKLSEDRRGRLDEAAEADGEATGEEG
jgi:multicomponent Na+:H+ antiporter subunit G